MRIAIVCGDDVFAQQGDVVTASDWHEQFCAALAARGHDVTAYPRRGDEHEPAPIEGAHRTVPINVGPAKSVSPRDVLPFIGEWANQLDQLWTSERPDIVHAFGWVGGLVAQLAARRRSLPTIQSFYGLASTADAVAAEDVERARLEPLLIRNATWLTGGSSDELDALTRLRRNRSPLSLLSSGVDVERFAASDLRQQDSRRYRILQVEPTTMPHNGFDKTIQILHKLPGAELVLAQTGAPGSRYEAEPAQIQRLAARAGVSDRVHFVGSVTPEELPPLLRSADVVACTPQRAPVATTALQAMASGVVVVGVAVGALVDTVINGVTGMLVSPTSPHELTVALKTLQTERFLRHSMGSAGRSRALSRFTWDRIALDALNIYHQATVPHDSLRRRTTARTNTNATA